MQANHPALIFSHAAPEDAVWLRQWEKHLLPLQQAGHLTTWSEQHLEAGANRKERIDDHLNHADLIVFLLGPDFFATNECLMLMKQALVRQRSGQVRIVPLLLKPSAWQDSPMGLLPYLPTNGRPITQWHNRNEAWQECANGIRHLLGLPKVLARSRRQRRTLTVEQQNRIYMLGRLRRAYESVLQGSLQGTTRVELGLAEKVDAVSNAAKVLLRMNHQDERLLPPGTSIFQAYDAAKQELLILGEAGVGKSTLLTELALHLVKRAEEDEGQPLPVLVPLSSWAARRLALRAWLSEQVSQIYGISRQLSEDWVQKQQFLPLLDGLDEMDKSARPACIAAINAYHREYLGALVVGSRTAEYEDATDRQLLFLQNAVVVQLLSPEQVETSLTVAGEPLADLRRALKENPALQDLAKRPLMLNILALTYQGAAVQELPKEETLLQQRIWEKYVERMVERKGDAKRYPFYQTVVYLHCLAQRMQKRNLTIFSLEQLQPDWLPKRRRSAYSWSVALLFALVGGLVVGLLFALVGGLVVGLAFGVVFGRKEKIELAEHTSWSWRNARFWLVGALVGGLIVGLIFGMIFGSVGGLTIGLVTTLIAVLVFGSIGGLTLKQYIKRDALRPGEGLCRSLKNGLIVGLIFALISELIVGLGAALIIRLAVEMAVTLGDVLVFGLRDALIVTSIVGLVTVLVGGLGAFIQHFSLRFWLWRTLVFPLNLPRFLEDARARVLLQRVGGGYTFTHRLLLDYFANLNPRSPLTSATASPTPKSSS